MDTEANPEAIYREALIAAETAIEKFGPEDTSAFNCGFAWVVVRPARGKFVSWCKANGHGSRHWQSGWEFWCPGNAPVQQIDIHRAGANAFANVLVKHGLEAHVGARLD